MFQFNYNYRNYCELLNDLGKATNSVVINKVLNFSGKVFTGFCECVDLPNGLEALITNIHLTEDVFFQRNKSDEEFYVLRMEEMSFEKKLTLRVGEEDIPVAMEKRAAVILTSSLFNFGYIASKDTIFKSVAILLDKAWMAQNLGIKKNDEILQKYIALKAENLNLEPFDAHYHQLFDEIINDHHGKPFQKMFIQNRMMLLVEYFFERLYNKMAAQKNQFKIKGAEIEKLMKAEALLVNDFNKPAPTIPELARKATMSETKFKTFFKKIYGHSPYNYYQLNRMNRARQMLLSKKYSVKEVGRQLGFSNLSNFTIAFKKVFNELPSEL